MKKIVVVLAVMCMMFGASSAFARMDVYSVAQSSFTASDDSVVYVEGTEKGDILVGVVVSTVSASGSLILYDSQVSAANTIAVIDLATIQNAKFDVRVSSGIAYTTANNSQGVTILYRKQ